jgi:hypothetical protein
MCIKILLCPTLAKVTKIENPHASIFSIQPFIANIKIETGNIISSQSLHYYFLFIFK